ncbi:MAG: hypothetical protein PHS60_15835 [Zavarzinia sp.]|nr:hypothetical protein [Zavarzinia sp.]
MSKRLLFALSAVLALAACTTWEKPGATDTDRDRDLAACEVAGYDRYPPLMQRYLAEPAHWEPPDLDCHYDKNGRLVGCTSSGGYWIPDRWATRDANTDARQAVIDDCMFKQGWHKERR